MIKVKNIHFCAKLICVIVLVFVSKIASAHDGDGPSVKKISSGDTLKTPSLLGLQLDKDEAIKCTRAELLSKEFVVVGTKNYPELLRITFQDLERGSREIIFQKKINESDEVKFTMPLSLIKETAMAVLIVMKGDGMFFKKIDITD